MAAEAIHGSRRCRRLRTIRGSAENQGLVRRSAPLAGPGPWLRMQQPDGTRRPFIGQLHFLNRCPRRCHGHAARAIHDYRHGDGKFAMLLFQFHAHG